MVPAQIVLPYFKITALLAFKPNARHAATGIS